MMAVKEEEGVGGTSLGGKRMRSGGAEERDTAAPMAASPTEAAPLTTVVRASKRARPVDADAAEEGAADDDDDKPLPPCDVCKVKERLYCCPRCGVKTCSLACCKAHKAQTACTGRRDRFEKVPLSQFTDAQLRADYFFLEEVINSTQAAKRKLLKAGGAGASASSAAAAGSGRQRRGQAKGRGRRPQQHQHPHNQQQAARVVASPGEGGGLASASTVAESLALAAQRAMGLGDDWLSKHSPRAQRLVTEARRRGVVLLLTPEGMSRRRQNTSRVAQDGKFLWRVEWSFVLPPQPGDPRTGGAAPVSSSSSPDGGGAVRLVDAMHDETRPLLAALARHLEPRPGNAPMRQRLRAFCRRLPAMTVTEEKQKQQQEQGEGEAEQEEGAANVDEAFHLYLERQPRRAASPRYWRLDPRQPLGEELKGKIVIEFPTVYVALPFQSSAFPLAIEQVGEDAAADTATGDEDESSDSSSSEEESEEEESESDEEEEEEEEDAAAAAGEPAMARLTVNERLEVGDKGSSSLAALLSVYNDDDDEDEDQVVL